MRYSIKWLPYRRLVSDLMFKNAICLTFTSEMGKSNINHPVLPENAYPAKLVFTHEATVGTHCG
jgi:hypothetical protein